MLQGPRQPEEHEFDKLIHFLDKNLRPNSNWSLNKEYPTAFNHKNLHNIRMITQEDRILSHAALKTMIVKTPTAIYKVAAIGSVITEENSRNQGLSHQVISDCLKLAQEQNCDFAILWSDLHDFYHKLGFELAGSEVCATIGQNFNPPTPSSSLKFLKSSQVAAEAIYRLYNTHTVVSVRTLDEIRKCLQIPNSKVYTAWDSSGKLQAFAIEGKGADLGGYIHEWAGSTSSLLPLFKYIQSDQQRDLNIICPKHSQNLIKQLKDHQVPLREGYLGMIKILNENQFFSKIQRTARNIGISNLILRKNEQQYCIGTPQNIFATQSERDITQLIFGPHKPSQLHDFDDDTKEILDQIFPINMWVWGWDSI